MITSKKTLQSEEEWNNEWLKWFVRYSSGNPRLGKWISSTYRVAGAEILEIGAGSARESRFLAARAKCVNCVDFSPAAINLLTKSRLPENMKVLVADASVLPFPEKAFDLSFHKGVWVLFNEDEKLELFLEEQLRVTKGVVLAIVQNARNFKQVKEADLRSVSDPLFRIRFFDPDELKNLAKKVLKKSCVSASVRVLKYGNPRLSKIFSPFGVFGDWIVSKIYRFIPWKFVECGVLEIVKCRS